MPQTVQEALDSAVLYTVDEAYHLVRLPPAAITAAAGVIAEIGEPFCALIADKDEVTLVIPAEATADFAPRLPGHTISAVVYRLITLDIELDPNLTGFMAKISTALAQAGVSILPYAAFSRDHLLVAEPQLALAISTLESLKSDH